MINTIIPRKKPILNSSPNNKKRSRIYVLLSVTPGNVEYAAQLFRNISGVITVDMLEGDPNLLLVLEAEDRLQLADSLIEALSAPGDIIVDLDLLISSE